MIAKEVKTFVPTPGGHNSTSDRQQIPGPNFLFLQTSISKRLIVVKHHATIRDTGEEGYWTYWMYTFLTMRLMVYGSQGHKPSVILPEKHACASQKKQGELHSSETMVRRREKFISPKSILTPNVPTRRIVRENKRRILNLWMEINGMH